VASFWSLKTCLCGNWLAFTVVICNEIFEQALYHLQQVGKYFKQSAKAFEQQVAREARFYGALIR